MITLIITTGNSSLDKYSQLLSKGLTNDKIEIKMPVSFKEGFDFFKKMRKYETDIFHLPHQQFARYLNFINKPCIITVHDLSLQCSSLYDLNNRMKIYVKLDKIGINKASHIIAISKSTKQDLITELGIPEDKISVIYQGVDHSLYKPIKSNECDLNYILYVGSEQPRKNFGSLLKAFYLLKQNSEFKDFKLIKIGEPGLKQDRHTTLKIISELNLQEEVIFTGFIPEAMLPLYYSNAACFVLPSLYEGFGLTVPEAMACGCPVISSNVSSLLEIAGDAAIFVDPYDVSSIANSITIICTDNNIRDRLTEKGIAQSKKYSWDDTARKTIDVYEKFC